MLSRIVGFSIRFPGLVVACALALLGAGAWRLATTGLDIFPEFSPKAVIVQTEAPGYTTEQVEALVTRPIELGLAGLSGLSHVRSESIEGLSVVTAVFEESSDRLRIRQFVTERLATVREQLPPSASAPVVVPFASSSATVRTIGIQADDGDLLALRDLVDATLVPHLLGVPGVADVNVFGGGQRMLEIRFDAEALRRHGLGIDTLQNALALALDDRLPLGAIDNANQRLSLRFASSTLTPAAMRALVVARREGQSLTLGEVASVGYAEALPIGAAQIGGKPAIVMMVIAQYGANTLTVSNRLREVLEDFERTLAPQGYQLHPALFVPANYIEASLANISEHLMLGAGFVLLILFLFLFDARAAFISAAAIPLSLLGAVLVLLAAGVNLNIMVLGGLAIALGEVVDDAIIDTENIYRRLRADKAAGGQGALAAVIHAASLEVRGSVVYASFIVAIVFVPLLTLPGVAGRLFAPLGLTYITAILASLAVAVTLTPALCALLLRRAVLPTREPPLVRWLLPRYTRLLAAACARPRTSFAVTALICLLTLGSLPGVSSAFLPPLREGHYIMHTTGLPGASLTEAIRLGTLLSQEVATVPGVVSVSQWAGRAERGADTYGTHYSEYEVRLAPLGGEAQQRVLDDIRGILARYPGLRAEINTFLTERVDETISGYASPVVVNLYGHDLAALDVQARKLLARIAAVPGAAAVQLRAEARVPQIQVAPQPAALEHHGLTPGTLRQSLSAAFNGVTLGQVTFDDRQIPVVLRGAPALRESVDAVAQLPLRGTDGHPVRLDTVAEVAQVEGRYNILHRGGLRVQTVTASVEGVPLSVFWRDLKTTLAEVSLPADMRIELTGAAVEEAEARTQLIANALLAGLAVLALIYVALGSLRQTMLILANLPFALVGGVMAVQLTGGSLSIGSVVGFVTLFGITVRNSIMLLSHYRHLLEAEAAEWSLALVLRGAAERLPSILMTALVTALAMLPIALNSDNPGREIMGPMAAIIIGGLLSSAALNLLVMPALAWRYGGFASGGTTASER
jgi:CzcA family heavy metal efflux pump